MNFAAQKAIYDSDIANVEPEMPFSFIWQDVTYVATRNEINDTVLMTQFGYIQEFDFFILVRVSLFAAGVNWPRVNSKIQCANFDASNPAQPLITLTVKGVKASPDGVDLIMAVQADN